MKKLFANKATLVIVIGAIIVIGFFAFIVINMTATTKAVVLNTSASSGTTLTDGMLKEIDVPKDTPGDFKKSKQALIGERLTVNMAENQLIYNSNITSGIDLAKSENEEFVTCSIKLDDDQAMGGLLTAGDKVDVAVMPKSGKSSILASSLPGMSVVDGQLTYVLSNVKLLDTTTALSSQQGSSMSTATTDGQNANKSSNKTSHYYMMALSYNDYKKLKNAEENGTLYLNLCPKNNDEYAPLLDQMKASVKGELTDSAAEPIKEKKNKNNNDNKEWNKDNKDNNNNNDNNDNKESDKKGNNSGN